MDDGSRDILISELTEESPYARQKLEAAWSSLTEEAQMRVLLVLRKQTLLCEPVLTSGLKSKSPYVRYLSALTVLHSKDPEYSSKKNLLNKIKKDKNDLVRSTLQYLNKTKKLSRDIEIENALHSDENFFLEQQRFEEVRDATISTELDELAQISVPQSATAYTLSLHLEYFSNRILERIKRGEVSDKHALNLIRQLVYSLNQTDIVKYHAKHVTEPFDVDLTFIWHLTHKLPEKFTFYILASAPTELSGTPKIEKHTFLSLSPIQLITLFKREDCRYPLIRKEIFFNHLEEKNFALKAAAARYHMALDYIDLERVFESSDKMPDNAKALMHSDHFEACMIEAINDFVRTHSDEDQIETQYYRFELRNPEKEFDPEFPRYTFTHHLERLSRGQEKQEATNLALYRIAKLPKDELEIALSGELNFLKKKVVPRNPWRTFMRFHEALFEHKAMMTDEEPEKDLDTQALETLKREIDALMTGLEGRTHRTLMQAIAKQAEMLQLLYKRQQETFKLIGPVEKPKLAFSKKVKYASILGIFLLCGFFLVYMLYTF